MRLVYFACVGLPSKFASSVHIMHMVDEFAELGHEVILVDPNLREGVTSKELADYYGLKNNCFKIKDLRKLKKLLGLRGVHRFKNYLYWLYFKALNANLLYIRDQAVGEFGDIVCELSTPFVLEAHLPNRNIFLDRLLSNRRLAKFVVISSSLKEEFVRLYPSSKSKVSVHHDAAQILGAHKDKKTPNNDNTKLSFNSDKFVGAYIGNLYPGKCMEELVTFVGDLAGDIQIRIYGGNDLDILNWKSRLHELSISNVTFKGYLNPAALFQDLSDVNFFLAPFSAIVTQGTDIDLTPWMSPLKIFEYMAMNKPIVSTDLPVIREILEHEYNALLCKPGDKEGWLNAISLLKRDRLLCDRIAFQAFKDWKLKYTWKIRAESVLEGISL
jgi:glycosyltransferase involved in cell wall biosynthesis